MTCHVIACLCWRFFFSFCRFLFFSFILLSKFTRVFFLGCSLMMKRNLILKAKHANEAKCTWGIDGSTGIMTDMKDLGIWEPFTVKTQTYKTAVEASRVESNGAIKKDKKNTQSNPTSPINVQSSRAQPDLSVFFCLSYDITVGSMQPPSQSIVIYLYTEPKIFSSQPSLTFRCGCCVSNNACTSGYSKHLFASLCTYMIGYMMRERLCHM